MTFVYKEFSCDIEVYTSENNIVVKFYAKSKEQTEEEISDLVIVDPGYGYINLKLKGKDSGLMSGFLDENIFTDSEMINHAIDFVENLLPEASGRYTPYHVCKVKITDFEEYNGEY